MKNSFFALLFRQKYIKRWGLMRNTVEENLAQHSAETAFVAHALAVIGNEVYGKAYDADKIALLALYHDASEIVTGDLPTPIKYYSQEMRENYKAIEENAAEMLLERISERFRPTYATLLGEHTPEDEIIIKAADKICALIKCIEELKCGNREFVRAEKATAASIERMNCPEANYFMKEFLPAFYETLDENSDRIV